MIKFIGSKKVEGVSKTTQKKYSFNVGYFTNDSDNFVNGSSCFESIVTDSFVNSFHVGDSFKEIYYNDRKQVATGIK